MFQVFTYDQNTHTYMGLFHVKELNDDIYMKKENKKTLKKKEKTRYKHL